MCWTLGVAWAEEPLVPPSARLDFTLLRRHLHASGLGLVCATSPASLPSLTLIVARVREGASSPPSLLPSGLPPLSDPPETPSPEVDALYRKAVEAEGEQGTAWDRQLQAPEAQRLLAEVEALKKEGQLSQHPSFPSDRSLLDTFWRHRRPDLECESSPSPLLAYPPAISMPPSSPPQCPSPGARG